MNLEVLHVRGNVKTEDVLAVLLGVGCPILLAIALNLFKTSLLKGRGRENETLDPGNR